MKLDLHFEELFTEPADDVWRALTDPRVLARWLMANDFEAVAGHRFTLRDPPTPTFRGLIACEVLEIDAPRRMVWSWDAGQSGESRTQVVLEVRSEPNGTRLVVRHEGEVPSLLYLPLSNDWERRLAIFRSVVEPDYTRRVAFERSPEHAFDAVATIAGLQRWWTTRVSGSEAVGGELRFEFEGLPELIVMRIDRADRPSRVVWTCIVHTRLDDWAGSHLVFDFAPLGPAGCELVFRHVGLTPSLECFAACERAWDQLLSSLAAYADRGEGQPFGKPAG